jgi:hypothetical protein
MTVTLVKTLSSASVSLIAEMVIASETANRLIVILVLLWLCFVVTSMSLMLDQRF